MVPEETEQDNTMSKKPEDFTLEEYEAMSPAEKEAFYDSFENSDAFDLWMEKEKAEPLVMPWEEDGAKGPSEYSIEEYNALTPEQKEAFYESFESADAFDLWMSEAQANEGELPWKAERAKQPAEYTWEEYEALTASQREAFFESFENKEDFDAWLEREQPAN